MAVTDQQLAEGNFVQRRLLNVGLGSLRYVVLVAFFLIFIVPIVWISYYALK